jgi:hypothetical protein
MGTNYYRSTGEHIGKQSMGWSFCFCDNYGFNTFDDAVEWINEHEIVDEYGRDISKYEFWCMVARTSHDENIPYDDIDTRQLNGYDFLNAEFC